MAMPRRKRAVFFLGYALGLGCALSIPTRLNAYKGSKTRTRGTARNDALVTARQSHRRTSDGKAESTRLFAV